MSPILEASPRSEKPMSTTDQVTAMCQQMSLELAFLTNSTANDDFSEKFKLNDPKNIGKIINKFVKISNLLITYKIKTPYQ